MKHLFRGGDSTRFFDSKALNEVPFFICPYPARRAFDGR